MPPLQKLLAFYLATFMNDEQAVAWPSLSRICKECNLSRPSVVKHLAGLEASGWLLKEATFQSSNRYHAIIPSDRLGLPVKKNGQKVIHRVVNEVNYHSKGVVNEVNHPSKGGLLSLVNEVNPNISVNNSENNKQNKPSAYCCAAAAAIRDLWNEMLPELDPVLRLTPKRQKRIAELSREELPELEDWQKAFGFVRKSKFLMGRTPTKAGMKPFRCRFDWLIQGDRLVELYEGKFDD